MRQFLITNFWFTVIVVAEVVKWTAAGMLVKTIPWLARLIK